MGIFSRAGFSDRHFKILLAEYDAEQEELENKLKNLHTAEKNYNTDSVKIDSFTALARHYADSNELKTPMLNDFIEKIIVHEGDKTSGRRIQKTDIYFNFIGEFTVPDGYKQ